MLFNSPICSEHVDRIIARLRLDSGHCCVEIGCGAGEFLIRVVETTGAAGLGLDLDRESIAEARERARHRVRGSVCEFRTADIREAHLEAQGFDLAVCIGSTHAFGHGESAYPTAVRKLLNLVGDEGKVLVGETFWRHPPASDYLALIGDPVGTYRDHGSNISVAAHHGGRVLHATLSDTKEWDDFERSHMAKAERAAVHAPESEQVSGRIERQREWYEGYRRWGRTSMGFACYLIGKAK